MNTAKRQPNERFEHYKLRREAENDLIRQQLKGRFVWISAYQVMNPDTGQIWLVKAQGTYIKPKVAEDQD